MATALDDLPAVTRVRDNGSDDARLFSLLDELRKCEKCRDDLLDHLWSEHSDQVEAADYTRLVGSERVVDLTDASLDHLAAVQEIVVEDFKDGRGENARDVRRVKLKLHDKKGALVDIGRELGMFINRTEQGRPGEFDGLNREEMEQHLVDELVAGGIPEKTARAFIRARSPQ